MKLLILSDLHLEFHPMWVLAGDFDAVVLARDIQAPDRRGVVWAAVEQHSPASCVDPHGNRDGLLRS